MKTLEQLEDLYNSHPRESSRLLALCSGDLGLLETVYKKLKADFKACVPGTKNELNNLLNDN